MTSNSIDTDNIWVYHERQQALLCGQHALNNLVQQPAFTPDALALVAQRLDQLELDVLTGNERIQRIQQGSAHVNEQGYFSIEVLRTALQDAFGVRLAHVSQQNLLQSQDITDCQGFICHKSDHWFAIRQVGGRFWNLNSQLELPTPISHFGLATDIQSWATQGYTVFCVTTGLPDVGRKNGTGELWHRMSNLLRGNNQRDPWEQVGSGMRLDGKTNSIQGLTEEEQLQLAMQASMEAATAAAVVVPDEPPAGPNAVRIQFRMHSKRVVRRFLSADPVSIVYAYCQDECGGSVVELKCGFPPKLLPKDQTTVSEAKLANESVQVRII